MVLAGVELYDPLAVAVVPAGGEAPTGSEQSQTPLRHAAPRQLRPQAPQLLESLASVDSHPFVGFASQLPNPPWHENWQLPCEHVSDAEFGAGSQMRSHAPQLSMSLLRFFSQPSVRSPSQLPNPTEQVAWHAPPEQLVDDVFGPPGQDEPHVPQLEGSELRSVSQLALSPLQSANPSSHVSLGMVTGVHVPAWQVPAPGKSGEAHGVVSGLIESTHEPVMVSHVLGS